MIINWKETIYDENGYNFYNGGWVKRVDSVDTSKSNGYAFEGDFVQNAKSGLTECSDGFYIICSMEGSRKNQSKKVAAYEIAGEKLNKVIDWVSGNDWALQIRDRVAKLLNEPVPAANPLADISTEDLITELKRREREDV